MTRIAVLVAISCLFAGHQVQAKCSPELDTLEAKVKAAEFVFVAWVESATAMKKPGNATTLSANYQAIQSLKGDVGETGSVSSNLTTGGMEFTPGLIYLFFLYPESDGVGFCGGSRRLDWYNAYEAGARYEEAEDEHRLLSTIRELAAE